MDVNPPAAVHLTSRNVHPVWVRDSINAVFCYQKRVCRAGAEMKEPVGVDTGDLIISDRQIPFGAYQAIYHRLTRRVEKINKEYDEGVSINIGDLENLNNRVLQLIQQYNVQGTRCQVTHSLKDSYSYTYSSFEKFKMSDPTSMDCTANLNYEFDFMVILPSDLVEAREIAQRYKLSLLFEQTFIDKTDARLPFFLRDLPQIGSLNLVLEYSDYAVAQSIESTVSGWVRSLPKEQKNKILGYFISIDQIVQTYFGQIMRLIPLLAGAYGIAHSKNASISLGSSQILFSLALAHLSYTVADFLGGRFYAAVSTFVPSPMVVLTRGDSDRKSKISRRRAGAKAALSLILVAIMLAIGVNLFSAWLYRQLF